MRLFMLLLVGLLYSQQLLAWGKTGHRVIGEIAEHYLSPSARLTVAELLIDEGLAEASTWADFMRSNQDEFWQKTATPWHYVTVPRGTSYADTGAPPQGDAITALQRFNATLTDAEAELEDRQLALRFIVHIVGDLHQPLHVGNGEDKGGNDFDVVYFDQPTNLHRVWDSQIIDNEKLSFSEKSAWLLEKISAADFRAWNNPDPLVWIAESAVWRDQLYPAEIRLKWNYDYQWLPVINQRLSQAGVRVAAYLNTLLVPAAAMQPPVAAE
ncbi:MAG: S1/P1 nuclease [Gammaproteobacteria bacterium]|jgi:hypothetical protein|nr:S1/P1 nuclease [Gammaproteobacteria bacterium]